MPAGRDSIPVEPIIDRAIVEKTEVCAGEETFVKVEAHLPDGANEYLVISVQDPLSGNLQWGSQIPLRFNRAIDRPIRVTVQGKGGFRSKNIPPLKVLDCVTPHQVTIDVERTVAATDRVKLKAHITEPPAEGSAASPRSFVAHRYEWDFGDGNRETSSASEIEHSYEARDQSVAYSSFVATVKIKDREGNEIQGSHAVAFSNPGFAPLVNEARVVISAGVKESPAPQPGVTTEPEKIWLYHGYSKAVVIEHVRIRETVLEGNKERETFSREYAPEDLLGFRDLPPHESRTTRQLTDFQPTNENETAVRYVEVRGRTADGKDASGTFTLLPPKRAQHRAG
jgi:hypothetical protein